MICVNKNWRDEIHYYKGQLTSEWLFDVLNAQESKNCKIKGVKALYNAFNTLYGPYN